jgi:uncharacterized membrane protein YhaH (DUF805 family)
MAEPENPQTWFILHDGERFGPYTVEELKQGVEAKEINPRIDMAWKEGLADWIPAGEVEGLFEKKVSAENKEEKKESKKEKKESKSADTAFSEFEYGDDGPTGSDEEVEWIGISRFGYFFFCFIFPALWWVGGFYGLTKLAGVIGEEILPIVIAFVAFLPFLIVIIATVKRFQNLAMSGFWFFGLFTPLIIWLYYRLFACPPGYAEHKRLGALGWFLAIIYWLPFVGTIFLGAIAAIQGPDKYQDVIEKNRGQYDSQYNEFMLKFKEATASPEEKKAKEEVEKAKQKAKEEVEKGPSIIPIQR